MCVYVSEQKFELDDFQQINCTLIQLELVIGQVWGSSSQVKVHGHKIITGSLATDARYNTIQYNIRLLEAVRTQRRTIIEREKYVENENVKMVHNE